MLSNIWYNSYFGGPYQRLVATRGTVSGCDNSFFVVQVCSGIDSTDKGHKPIFSLEKEGLFEANVAGNSWLDRDAKCG